jgi:hypothetical protein
MTRQKGQVGATLKRLFWISAGLGFIAVGLFRERSNGEPLALWRRLLVIAVGLFLVYCGSMYYLPKHRKLRAEQDRMLNESDSKQPTTAGLVR